MINFWPSDFLFIRFSLIVSILVFPNCCASSQLLLPFWRKILHFESSGRDNPHVLGFFQVIPKRKRCEVDSGDSGGEVEGNDSDEEVEQNDSGEDKDEKTIGMLECDDFVTTSILQLSWRINLLFLKGATVQSSLRNF